MLNNSVILKTYNNELDEIIIAFMDQTGRALEVEEKLI